jgi:hypothetical protein
MSNFDPSMFLDATITEASVKRLPLPAGMDFVGTIDNVESRAWTSSKDPSKSGIVIDATISIDLNAYPDVKAAVGGADKVTMKDGIMLDLTPGGTIDTAPGKNGKLRRYREALGMNTPGEAFSFRAMTGRQIKVKIKHEPYEGEIYDKIDSVAKV